MTAREFASAIVLAVAAASPAPAVASGGSDLELGRALYFGVGAFDASARVDGIALPREATSCVQCHGALGEGVREGPQAAPALHGGGWSAQRLRDALAGAARTGRSLAPAMPRFAPSATELAALAAYLDVLGTERDAVRGVTAHEVTLGLEGTATSRGPAARQVAQGVRRAVDEANARGGVHGRRLRLVDGADAADGGAPPVLALIGTLSAGPGKEAWLAARRLPDAASLALLRERVALRAWTVPLLPALSDQVDLLGRELQAAATARQCAPAWIGVGPDGPADADGGPRVAEPGRTAAGRRICIASTGEPAAVAAAVRTLEGRGAVVPLVLSLAARGPVPPRAPADADRRVVPVPRAVLAASVHGDGLWATLGEASGRAVIEALARSGRLLQPEILRDRLRGLGGFAPVDGAPLAFGPTQSHGWRPEVDGGDEARRGPAAPARRTLTADGERP